MKSIFILFVLLLAGNIAADEQIDDIYSAYEKGELEKARILFRKLPATSTRDGNRLFVGALLEPDVTRARELLTTSIKSDLDGKYIEEAHFRLIQMAEAAGDTSRVLSQGKDFLHTWEDSRYREPLLALMAAHEKKGSAAEKRFLDLLTEESPGSYYGQSARLMKASSAFEEGNYRSAETLCRRINNTSSDELVPSSLILLARIGLRKGQTERALLNYNILREQYRDAIGQDELVLALKSASDEASEREADQVYEGITYSVQVGVFSVKDNAKDMAERVEAYGYESQISRREISGKEYYVVLAGKFETSNDAEIAKEKLEMGENEIFKVVVND